MLPKKLRKVVFLRGKNGIPLNGNSPPPPSAPFGPSWGPGHPLQRSAARTAQAEARLQSLDCGLGNRGAETPKAEGWKQIVQLCLGVVYLVWEKVQLCLGLVVCYYLGKFIIGSLFGLGKKFSFI